MHNHYQEILRGPWYGDSLELVEWVIIPRVEELWAVRYAIQHEYKDLTQKHAPNPMLYEVLQEGDPSTLIDDPRRECHKEFLFDIMYMREVRGINPLPRSHAYYSYLCNQWYVWYDDLTELITKYFGMLTITTDACKAIAQEFNTYCKQRDTKWDDDVVGEVDPYYAQIYNIYVLLMNDEYTIGGVDMAVLKRYVSFLHCQRECLPTFLKSYLYDDYPWESEPLFVRGHASYQRAVGEMINLLHQIEHVYGTIHYEKMEEKLLREVGYPQRSASDAIVYIAIREHAILNSLDSFMSSISNCKRKNIVACRELVKVLHMYHEVLQPFLPAIEKLMQQRHHFLRGIYLTPISDS